MESYINEHCPSVTKAKQYAWWFDHFLEKEVLYIRFYHLKHYI